MASTVNKLSSQLPIASNMASSNRLSASVILYSQSQKSSATDPTEPKLILLATWMDARDVHIAKYIARYQTLYPTASILLVKSFFRYYFSPNSARSDLKPAVEVIHDVLDHSPSPSTTERNSKPRMLIHVFSNGGSCMLYHLYDLYSESAPTITKSNTYNGRNDLHHNLPGLLPPHVTIFDSVPGRWSYTGSTQGVLAGLPSGWMRKLLSPLVHLLGLWWAIKYRLLKIPEETHVWGLAHNDPTKARETCRSYIYSEADELVYHQDVDEHADHAEANGYVVIRREKLIDSQHVSHARSHPDIYWALVKDTWEAGQHGVGSA